MLVVVKGIKPTATCEAVFKDNDPKLYEFADKLEQSEFLVEFIRFDNLTLENYLELKTKALEDEINAIYPGTQDENFH